MLGQDEVGHGRTQQARNMHSVHSTHRGRHHLLVSTGVNGADVFEAEVPLQVRLHKGRHKAATGSIHMNFDIVTLHADLRSGQRPSHMFICSLQLSRSDKV